MKKTLGILPDKLASLFHLSVLFVFVTFFCTPTNAQTSVESSKSDSSKSEEEIEKSFEFFTFSLNEIYPDTFVKHEIDTLLSNFFNYNFNLYNFQNNLGNAGSPQQSLLSKDTVFTGLNTQFDNLYGYRFGLSTMQFRELTQPFATATYINGAQKEEGINIELSQNVREHWNFSLGYRKISSEGFYVRQRNAINNFYVNQHFKTKNQRYQLMLYGLYNETYNEENGGLQNDTLFTNAEQKFSRKGFPVNYSNALNRSRNQEYLLKQRFNFGPKTKYYYKNEQDSIYPDSIILEKINPKLTLEHNFIFTHQEFVYEDKLIDSINYPFTILGNNIDISDKTIINKIDNEFAIIVKPWLNSDSSFATSLRLKAGAGIEYANFAQFDFSQAISDNYYNNTYIKSSLYNLPGQKIHLNAQGKLILAGYNEADFSLGGKIVLKATNKIKIGAEATSSVQRPALIFDQYTSTGWNWKTNFNKIGIVQTEAFIQLDSAYLKAGVLYQATSNYTYFDTTGLPTQFNGTISTIRPYLQKLFNLNPFHLRVSGGYQLVDKSGIINVPEFFTYNSLYIESKIFKSEMLLRLGTDFFYISNYFADNYNPSTRQFYVQNKQEVGNYPWLEPFLMVNVERFYFFLRVANINEGIPGYNYLARPGYPMQDRALKFSIRWDFIN